ncbi:MAG: InlB B-repeat-containing protein [Clostridiales bacterium]|jgi:uncharacterized repeat protein (TIGR02543 family)|nr:InlB B-repeat-containing protein [Clostridiales bacterium]
MMKTQTTHKTMGKALAKWAAVALLAVALLASVLTFARPSGGKRARAEGEEPEAFALTLIAATLKISADGGDIYGVQTPESESGSGPAVMRVYSVEAGALCRVAADPDPSDNLSMFVGFDWQYLNNRVGELGAKEYGFAMPDEDVLISAIYSASNLDSTTRGSSGKITNSNPSIFNNYGNGYIGIVKGVPTNEAEDPDLEKMSGWRLAIPGNTGANTAWTENISGNSFLSSMRGMVTIKIIFKNHGNLPVTLEFYIPPYGARNTSGEVDVPAGETVTRYMLMTVGCDGPYLGFNVRKAVGGEASNIILMDFVMRQALTYPQIDKRYATTGNLEDAGFVTIGGITKGSGNWNEHVNNNAYGLRLIMVYNQNCKIGTYLYFNITNFPAYTGLDGAEQTDTVYVRIITGTANPFSGTYSIGTAANPATEGSLLGSEIVVLPGASTTLFAVTVTRTAATPNIYFHLYRHTVDVPDTSGNSTYGYNLTMQMAYKDVFGSIVTAEDGEGYTLTPEGDSESVVLPGDSYSFRLSLAAGYTQSAPIVKAVGAKSGTETVLRARNGVYTVSNVQEGQTIVVENVALNVYAVTGLSGAGYTVTPEGGYTASVAHGGDFKFKIAVDTVLFDVGALTVKANGGVGNVSAAGDFPDTVYTISNITAAQAITVEGISAKTGVYIVSGLKGAQYSAVSQTAGVTVSDNGDAVVAVNELENPDFSFRLNPAVGYDVSGATVTANPGGVLTPAAGVYTVTGIDQNVSVSVSGVAYMDYAITYHLGAGETNGPGNPETYQIVTETFDLADASKIGYTFGGWYKTSAFAPSDLVESIAAGSYGAVNLYPKFTATPYTVTLDVKGGAYAEGYTRPQNYTIEAAQALPNAEQIARAGYTFEGWCTSPNGGIILNDDAILSIPQGSTGNKTYYAKWATVPYTIAYNRNGGAWAAEYTAPEGFTVAQGAAVILPAAANIQKLGYTFAGWYGADDFSGIVFASVPDGSTGDREYWAKWVLTPYTIAYNANGGANAPDAVKAYDFETAVTLPIPARTGYTFAGWYEAEDLSGTAVTAIAVGATGDKEYFADWTVTQFTVSYEGLNGATNTNPESYTYFSGAIVLADPTRTGYTFDGWTSDLNPTPAKGVKILAGSVGDRVFTANWTANRYTVAFNTAGGAYIPDQTVEHNAAANAPGAPYREGFTFDGWYTSADGGATLSAEKFAFDTPIAANTTLYAKWAAVPPATGGNEGDGEGEGGDGTGAGGEVKETTTAELLGNGALGGAIAAASVVAGAGIVFLAARLIRKKKSA